MKPGEQAGLAVARYLRAEEQVVPFRARPELDELLGWCTSGGHARIRLVTGNGGAGKTRLALQLGEKLSVNRWQQIWVKRGSEREVVAGVRKMRLSCLLVVDYAETRSELGDLLDDVAADEDGPELRVVLLARSAGDGEWWRRLLGNTEELTAALLEASPPVRLGPVHAAGGMQEVFDQAVTAFSEKLKVDRPNARLVLSDPDPVVLVVHAAALLAVADYAAGVGPRHQAVSGSEVLDALLRHEAHYWERTARSCGLDLDPSVLRRAVAAAYLIGADSETAARALLACIPDLELAERRGRVARWLHDLYPPDEVDVQQGDWLGPLRPDRLAEQLVVEELTGQRELIPRLFTGLDEGRAARALTVLGRAALTQDAAVGLLRRALTADLERLAEPALSVAVATNPLIGELLSQLINDQPIPQEALTRVAEAIPYPSLVLAETAAAVLQQLASGSADDTGRAEWLLELTNWLSDLGRWEEALAAIEHATGIFRRLAEDRPDAFLSALAKSLNNQSNCLGKLGRREEALAAIEEAVLIDRRLAEDRPDAFLPDLAASLVNQSNRLANLQRREEALAAIQQATDICLQLAEDNHPDFRLLDLAKLRHNKSACLADLGRWEEALPAIEHAADIFRRLVEDRPDAFLPHLAVVLSNQSGCLARLQRREEALAAIEEAVLIDRRLAEDRPEAFLPGLARSLNNQSMRLGELGRWEEALAAIENAVGIFRQLAGNHPDAFLPDLATSLYNLADALSSLNRDSEALAIREEADAARSGDWHSRKA